MGNKVAVEKSPIDWTQDNLKLVNKNKGYPQKYQQYIHTWRCYPSEGEPEIIEIQPFTILDKDNSITLKSNESYIIVHVFSTNHDADKSKLIKKQNLNSAIENSNSIQSIILSVQSTINPASSKSSIASDQINNKKVKIKPHFEIHVWNGKETSLITQAVALAKAYSFEEILTSNLTSMGALPYLINGEVLPCPTAFKDVKDIAAQLSPSNLLISNLFALNPSFGRIKASNGRSASLPYAFKKNNEIVNKSFSSLSLQVPVLELSDTKEKTETNIKLDKLKLYAKRCSNIAPNIYLSGEEVAYDKSILLENQISHIINCAGTYCVNLFPNEFEYYTINLYDSENEDISGFFLSVIEYVEGVLKNKGQVLFHCQQGVSRSSTILIMYLMWKNKETLEITHKRVKQIREISNPNLGFIYQLLMWEKMLFSPSVLYPLVMFTVPHSSTDLHFILKKAINNALDTRGVFIVQTGTTLFKWVGAKASEKLMKPTDEAIDRLQKYMGASATVSTIQQGAEPVEFTNLCEKFSNSINEVPEYTSHFLALDKM